MASPQELVGLSVGDSKFLNFWGRRDATGVQIEVNGEHLLSQPAKGISIAIDRDLRVETISMFSGAEKIGNKEYRKYNGPIPDGIRFGMKRQEVLRLLGSPKEENPDYSVYMGVEIRPWVKFSRGIYMLTVEFDKSGSEVVGVSVTRAQGAQLEDDGAGVS